MNRKNTIDEFLIYIENRIKMGDYKNSAKGYDREGDLVSLSQLSIQPYHPYY